MTLKGKLLAGYAAIGLIVLLYQWLFGSASSFAYALGQALVWPAFLFPGFGAFIGGVLLLLFLAFVMLT